MTTTGIETSASRMLAEHAHGDSYRTLGKRHGISHETARKVVIERGTQLIADLERTLLLAELTRDQGGEGLWPAIVIPPQQQADRMDALEMFGWCVKRLRERGWHIEIVTRTPPGGGVVFMLETRRSS